jgi:hypothetical protein
VPFAAPAAQQTVQGQTHPVATGLGLVVGGAIAAWQGFTGFATSAPAAVASGPDLVGATLAVVAVASATEAISGASAAGSGLKMMVAATKGGGGRGSNSLQPDPNASGDHSTFKTDSSGKVTNYAEWKANPQNPSGFDEGKRVDLSGAPHFDKVTGQDIPTPHVHEGGGVRPALPEEIP